MLDHGEELEYLVPLGACHPCVVLILPVTNPCSFSTKGNECNHVRWNGRLEDMSVHPQLLGYPRAGEIVKVYQGKE